MIAPSVSIVLPVYRQADHIERHVERFEQSLDQMVWPHETLLVVNGAGDRSLEVCRALERRLASVRVLEPAGPGWGRAVRTGLAEARGEWLCYTNSARTGAEDLVLLILYAMANPELVIKANRRIRESWRRRLGSLLYNLECRALFDLSYWDVNGTPKVFPRRFMPLLSLSRDDDLIDLEFMSACRRNDLPLLEVPILIATRRPGRSTTNLLSAFRMYAGAVELWRMQRR